VSLEIGIPLPNSYFNIGVNEKAIIKDKHVKVKLEVLGFDQGLWGDLEYFSGLVVNKDYEEVTSASIFTIDFTWEHQQREVKVCDTKLDETKKFGCKRQPKLDFGSP
jgi:hypothetical protein